MATIHTSAAASAPALGLTLDGVANASAVDLSDAVEDTAVSSTLGLPHKLTSERVRRRSELARAQAATTPTEEIELPELPTIKEKDSPGARVRIQELAVVAGGGIGGASGSASAAPSGFFGPGPDGAPVFRVDDDVEIARSFPSSLTPSVRFEEETGSTAELSPAQKAENRRRSYVNFATLCLCIFFEGWNDGTTGPLLPRIQEYYHVSYIRTASHIRAHDSRRLVLL